VNGSGGANPSALASRSIEADIAVRGQPKSVFDLRFLTTALQIFKWQTSSVMQAGIASAFARL
jgi:hypothetical protein